MCHADREYRSDTAALEPEEVLIGRCSLQYAYPTVRMIGAWGVTLQVERKNNKHTDTPKIAVGLKHLFKTHTGRKELRKLRTRVRF